MPKMTVEGFIGFLQSAETDAVLGGKTYLEIVQQVLDDIYADDSAARMLRPEPYAVTSSGQQTYTWVQLFPTVIDADEDSTIRFIKGLWKPELQVSDIEDYGRQSIPQFDQDLRDKRIYDADIYVNNEQQKVVFETDPGDSTDTWKADLWERAPTIALTDVVPVLDGWEEKLLLPGCRAWFEHQDLGKPGVNSELFRMRRGEYRDALERVVSVNSYSSEKTLFKIHEPNVSPQ